jgi:hypothetical protein
MVINDVSLWSLTCTRTPAEAGTDQNFPATDIVIATSKANYTLLVPADAEIGPQSASALNARLDALVAEASALKDQLAKKVGQCRICVNYQTAGDPPYSCDAISMQPSKRECSGYRSVDEASGGGTEWIGIASGSNRCNLSWGLECLP